MRHAHVPVTMGSARSTSATTHGLTVTDAWFPAGAVLDTHTHDRPIFAVMVGGSFETTIARRRLDCTPTTIWLEPSAERHANYVGTAGARVLVVQPAAESWLVNDDIRARLADVRSFRSPEIALDALRVQREIQRNDDVSSLAIGGLTLAMLATLARQREVRPAPPWLRLVDEFIRAHFRERIDIADLAAAAGVHPSHLAHAVRRHLGQSLGEYVRRLRVIWAAEQLVASGRSLSEIAIAAGFCDQSHFSREFKRRIGTSPASYRAARRR
jgi:AraC family transcriptional regulator